MIISGWGNYPKTDAQVLSPSNKREAVQAIAADGPLIARGLGRSYGDSSISSRIAKSLRLDRMLSFDEASGTLAAEAGVGFHEIMDVFVPRGWFLPVTPGTKFITVGGAIASDVHGKNHHKDGTFCDHVEWFDLLMADGTITRCTRQDNKDLFRATCGGMGLTGIILQAAFRLSRIETAYITQTTHKAANLDEVMDLFEANEAAKYSVAWIDCISRGSSMGRSLLMLGDHAVKADLPYSLSRRDPLMVKAGRKLAVPFDMPNLMLNKLSIKAFNFLYYNKATRKTNISTTSFDPFFFPLDNIHHWNRIYGKRGFVQYQFVLPRESGREGFKEIMRVISNAGKGSFLAVLKLFGTGNDNLLSFPMEGYTLALDFPMTKGLLEFLDTLDEKVAAYSGRVYLTKDARMSPESLRKFYPLLDKFKEIKDAVDPNGKFRSLQSDRLQI